MQLMVVEDVRTDVLEHLFELFPRDNRDAGHRVADRRSFRRHALAACHV